MGRMIGLTGQTGAGKSTVAAMFSKHGYFIVDGDVLAREVVNIGSPVLNQLCERFGNGILNFDNSLNRAALASVVFSDENNLKTLNSVTHPAITALALEKAQQAYENGFKYAMFDAAALFESGFDSLCYKTVCVTAPVDIRLERIIKRDGISREAALKRINAQKNEQYYISHSDIIIRNSSPYSLDREFERAVSLIESDKGCENNG